MGWNPGRSEASVGALSDEIPFWRERDKRERRAGRRGSPDDRLLPGLKSDALFLACGELVEQVADVTAKPIEPPYDKRVPWRNVYRLGQAVHLRRHR